MGRFGQRDRDGGRERVLVCRALKGAVLVSETEMEGARECLFAEPLKGPLWSARQRWRGRESASLPGP